MAQRKALLVLDVNHGDPGSLSLAAAPTPSWQLAECKTLGISSCTQAGIA